MFFNEPELTRCDLKQNIMQLHTKKQLNDNVTGIQNSKADVILMSLNLIFTQQQGRI